MKCGKLALTTPAVRDDTETGLYELIVCELLTLQTEILSMAACVLSITIHFCVSTISTWMFQCKLYCGKLSRQIEHFRCAPQLKCVLHSPDM